MEIVSIPRLPLLSEKKLSQLNYSATDMYVGSFLQKFRQKVWIVDTEQLAKLAFYMYGAVL